MYKIKLLLLYFWNICFDMKIRMNDRLLIFMDVLYKIFHEKPNVFSIEKTIEYIIENRVSVTRYGDGELKLITGKDISFQKYHPILQADLIKILGATEENILVCIPDIFDSLNIYAKETNWYWRIHLAKFRRLWYALLSKEKIYGNSFLSRCYLPYADKTLCKHYFDMLREIWNEKNVIVVEGRKSRLGIGNDLFDNMNSIQRILVPEINAYDKYQRILDEVLKQDKSKLILLAVGPSATVLAYSLSQKGYQAIDIGHIDVEYEWYLRGVNQKIPIPNKFVNEAGFGADVGELDDSLYQSQIKHIII